MGYSYVICIGSILTVNICNVGFSNYLNFRASMHKKINQKIYEKRFEDHASVHRLCYMMKLERINMEKKIN